MSRHIGRAALVAVMLGLLAASQLESAGPPDKTATDAQGDPLPKGAIARLGSTRLRHGETVSTVALLPDGKTLLTIAGDGVVRQWDLATNKLLRHFKTVPEQASMMMMNRGIAIVGGAAMVFSTGQQNGLSLSPDGKTLASPGMMDGSLRLWNTATGKELRKIEQKQLEQGISETCFTPDGKTLAVRSYNNSIRLFEVATGKKLRDVGKKPENNNNFFGGNMGMVCSPDGKTLVSTMGENANGKQLWHLVLHDVATGKELRRITTEEQNGMPYHPRFTKDSKSIFWVKWDGTIKVADVATGKLAREIKMQNQSGVGELLLMPDGKSLLVRVPNVGLRVLDFATGKETHKFETKKRDQASLIFWNGGNSGGLSVSADGKLAALAGDDHTVHLFDLAAGKERKLGGGHRSAVTVVAFAPDGKSAYSRGQDGTLRVWDAAKGKEQRQLKIPQGAHHFALSPDGKLLVASTSNNMMASLYDVMTGKEAHKLEGAKEGLGSLAFSRDGKMVAVYGAADKGASIWLYDAATGKQKQRLKVPTPQPDANGGGFSVPMTAVAGVSFSPDGRYVAATIDHNRLGIWDAVTGKDLPPILAPDQKSIQAAIFTPDSRCLVLGLFGEDGLRMWEVASGKQRKSYGKKIEGLANNGLNAGMAMMGGVFGGGAPMPFTRPAAGAALSPDGRLLAQARSDNTISVYDVAAGDELGRLKGHDGMVETLAFSPDGQTLLSGSRDCTGLIWDVKPLAAKIKPPSAKVDVEARWKQLSSDDAGQAFEAIRALAGSPAATVAALKDRLHPAAVADPDRIQKLIADLDSEQFAVRKKATTELEKIGESAAPLLRKALQGEPTVETRKRIDELLRRTDNATPRGDTLRTLRAIETLETIGTPDAKVVLQTLAKGTPEAVVTRAAQGAVERLR